MTVHKKSLSPAASRLKPAIGIDEVDPLKLDCEGAEYLIVSEFSALGIMDRIGWIRGEWHSRKNNSLLANCLGQTHAYNIDPNLPHEVGMFVGHRVGQV